MKLTKVRIKNFKCIHDSTEFTIDDITCLVGKNESGKTAILQALRNFNPFDTAISGFDHQNEYPVEANNSNRGDIVVEVTFSLEEADINEIEGFITCQCVNTVNTDGPTITLSKDYENAIKVVKYGFEVDTDAIVRHISADAGIKPNPSMTDPTKRAKDLLAQFSEGEPRYRILEAVASSNPKNYIYNSILLPRIPKFIYFDKYPQMSSVVNIDQLFNYIKSGNIQPSDQPIADILKSAEVNYDHIINSERDNDYGIAIRKAGNAIDNALNEIFDSWRQHDIYHMESEILRAKQEDPSTLRIYITDKRKADGYETRKPFETESHGFLWFFPFLMMQKHFYADNNDVVLLLDEPGLSLHAKAQEDLLGFFEKELAKRHQVIYTTHSPFMIDSNHLECVKLVENQSLKEDSNQKKYNDLGTKVSSNPFKVSKESLLPLQAALGYDISQNMLIGRNNLIVEGVSDQVYITTISRYLEKHGVEGLHPAWTIVPAGDIDKVASFTRLFGANTGLDLAVLVDAHKNGMQKIENLYEDGIIDEDSVMTYADFIPSKNEADVEDMFTSDFYLDLMNGVHGGSIKIGDLTNKHPRIICRLKAYFKDHPLPNGKSHPKTGNFSHFDPAIYLNHNIADLQIPEEVGRQFQDLFSRLNNLLVINEHKQQGKKKSNLFKSQHVVNQEKPDRLQLMEKFWTGLQDYMNDNSSRKCNTPGPRSYLRFGIGRGTFLIQTRLASKMKEIGIWLYMKGNDAKAHFHLLKEQQGDIHNEFGETLEWVELPGKERSRICLNKGDTDPLDENDWPQQYEWFTTKLERFYQVFQPRIKALNAADWIPEEDNEELPTGTVILPSKS